jgi:bifunctional DNase/RNase
MSLLRLTINRISYSQTQNGAYSLILDEVKGNRKLPIVIGGFEAQAIATELEKEIRPPRPLTHDLFKSFASHFDITIKKVIIHKLVEGVFYSSIICERDKIEEIIDSRTSDAVALALRFDAPIYTYESLLEKAGIVLDPKIAAELNPSENSNKTPQDTNTPTKNFENLSISELEKSIAEAIKKENYEIAAKLRDEISKRNSK